MTPAEVLSFMLNPPEMALAHLWCHAYVDKRVSGVYCTREKGHPGPHVDHFCGGSKSYGTVKAAWNDKGLAWFPDPDDARAWRIAKSRLAPTLQGALMSDDHR